MKKNLTLIFLLTIFCAAPVLAQEKTSVSENQCQYDKPDFVAEKINVYVTDATLQDILNYFVEQFDCDFVVDEKTAQIRVTTILEDIPWNIALDSILESKNLGLKRVGIFEAKPLFRVGNPLDLSGIICKFPEKTTDEQPLYTETIQVKNFLTQNDFHQLRKYIERKIPKQGKIEVDYASQTFTITDIRENVGSLIALITLLDDEAFYNQAEKDK